MTHFAEFSSGARVYRIVDLVAAGGAELERLPYVDRILLENVLRTAGADAETARKAILGWLADGRSEEEIPFLPGRVLMHDTTCGPALVDIAGMRSALAEAGGDPEQLNPVLPVDVSTDHSVAVDAFGTADALRLNMTHEFFATSSEIGGGHLRQALLTIKPC
jgi:aconitate hydratase